MRRLWPDPVDHVTADDLVTAERRPPWPERPWVATNMIVSVDGATSVAGRSAPLGAPADKELFGALRAVADVVVAGAGTVRAEGYGPARTAAARRTARRARGQSDRPRIAVVSRSLELDLAGPLFTTPGARPIVLTCGAAPADRRRAVGAVAELVVAGEAGVDLGVALGRLRAAGAGVVLVEGGPHLNGALVAEGLVDEWNVSLAPLVAGGDSPRAAVGAPEAAGHPVRLDRLAEGDGILFARWVREVR